MTLTMTTINACTSAVLLWIWIFLLMFVCFSHKTKIISLKNNNFTDLFSPFGFIILTFGLICFAEINNLLRHFFFLSWGLLIFFSFLGSREGFRRTLNCADIVTVTDLKEAQRAKTENRGRKKKETYYHEELNTNNNKKNPTLPEF